VELSALSAFCSGTESGSFSLVRRWRSEAGMPEQVFVRAPWEAKPFYLDFTSPSLVRMLVKQVRGALQKGMAGETKMTFTELLPGTDALWLHDLSGQRYTSEFRIVAMHSDDRAFARRTI
jgi:hypothetical protein